MDNTSGFISEQSSQPSTATSPTGSSTHIDATGWSWLEASPGKLAAGLFFGMVFGFLLQKGGVAKFDILIGVLLLENFVVVKVMMTAIIVGMIGSYLLRRANIIDFHINETKFGANILGGLIFGVGFGLLAYCPGTNAAAVGQGNLDALSGIVGLLLGSYVYAASSKLDRPAIVNWGQRGKLTLNGVMGISQGLFVACAVPVLILVLVLLELAGY